MNDTTTVDQLLAENKFVFNVLNETKLELFRSLLQKCKPSAIISETTYSNSYSNDDGDFETRVTLDPNGIFHLLDSHAPVSKMNGIGIYTMENDIISAQYVTYLTTNSEENKIYKREFQLCESTLTPLQEGLCCDTLIQQ